MRWETKASIETEQTEETSKTEVIVSDNKLFINSDLYNMSEEKVIFNAHGRLDPDNPSFGTDHIDHYRTLFVKENGGLTVGYVVKTTRGITLQTGKTFYFYNDLCLKERTKGSLQYCWDGEKQWSLDTNENHN